MLLSPLRHYISPRDIGTILVSRSHAKLADQFVEVNICLDEFNPDRWDSQQNISNFIYMPFLTGGRGCIGQV